MDKIGTAATYTMQNIVAVSKLDYPASRLLTSKSSLKVKAAVISYSPQLQEIEGRA